jgi:hypothetical protein
MVHLILMAGIKCQCRAAGPAVWFPAQSLRGTRHDDVTDGEKRGQFREQQDTDGYAADICRVDHR